MTGYRPGADTNAHRIDGDDQHDAYLALNSCSPLEAYFAVRLAYVGFYHTFDSVPFSDPRESCRNDQK